MAVGYPDDMVRNWEDLLAGNPQPATEQTSAGNNVIINPDLELGIGTFPESWTYRETGADVVPTWETTTVKSGSKGIKFVGTGVSTGQLKHSHQFPCVFGQEITLLGFYQITTGDSADVGLQIIFYTKDGTTIIETKGALSAGTADDTWRALELTAPVPKGAVYWQAAFGISSADGDIYFDMMSGYKGQAIGSDKSSAHHIAANYTRITRAQSFNATGTDNLYEVPAGKVFFITNMYITYWVDNVANNSILYMGIDTTSIGNAQLVLYTRTASVATPIEADSMAISFPIPLRANAGEKIVVKRIINVNCTAVFGFVGYFRDA